MNSSILNKVRITTRAVSHYINQVRYTHNDHLIVEKVSNYAVLKLNKKPVNSLDLDFMTKMAIQFDKFEQDKSIDGVILTSSLNTTYSAGLDINEVYGMKAVRGTIFWKAVQDMWLKLYGSNKIYIGAINGHAIAGGCLLAICCDYRIMTNNAKYRIGLNETALGIKMPFWLGETMANTIGYREAEKACQFGLLYSPEEALRLKLVDEIVDEKQLMERAHQTMKAWLKIPIAARQLTKSSLRKDAVNKLLSKYDSAARDHVEYLMKDFSQKIVGEYLEQIKSKKKV